MERDDERRFEAMQHGATGFFHGETIVRSAVSRTAGTPHHRWLAVRVSLRLEVALDHAGIVAAIDRGRLHSLASAWWEDGRDDGRDLQRSAVVGPGWIPDATASLAEFVFRAAPAVREAESEASVAYPAGAGAERIVSDALRAGFCILAARAGTGAGSSRRLLAASGPELAIRRDDLIPAAICDTAISIAGALADDRWGR